MLQSVEEWNSVSCIETLNKGNEGNEYHNHSLLTDNEQNSRKRGCMELQPMKRRKLSDKSELRITPVLVPKKESKLVE